MPWIITKDFSAIELVDGQNAFYPDTFTDIDYQISSRVSEHSSVVGSSKSDNKVNDLDRITLRGCIAGTALNKSNEDLFAGADSRTAAACEMLAQMAKAKDCVSFITDEKDFGEMMVESALISFRSGGVLTFDLSLVEFNAVSLQDVQIQVGQVVNRGEISTIQGQPTTLPDGVSINAQTETRLARYESNPTQFSNCDTLPPGPSADICYGTQFGGDF